MFFKPGSIFSALAILTAANPIAVRNGGDGTNQCNTGPIQCCDIVTKAADANVQKILGLLGVVLDDLNINVGLQCTPLTPLGDGSSCSQTPVCCSNNTYSGLIVIGCTWIVL